MSASDPGACVPDPVPSQATDGTLTETEMAMLSFERQWWKAAGAKEHAIHDRFGLTSTRYHQLLNRLIDRPEALRHDPVLVQRLLRTRQARRRAGAVGSLPAAG